MNLHLLIASLGLSAGFGIAAEPGSPAATGRELHAPFDLPDHRIAVRYRPEREFSSAVITPRTLPLPAYPAELLGTAVSGFAKLEFVIGSDGVVQDVRADADSHAGFVPAAVAAIQNWTFQPVADRKTSVPVAARMSAEFAFTSCRDDDGVPGLMAPFAHARLTGREVMELAEEAVRKRGVDLSAYPGFLSPNPNSLYPDISVYQGRDGRMKWLVRWSQRIDDAHWKDLSVWIDDQSRVARVNDAPNEWKGMPETDYAVMVCFRLGDPAPAIVPVSIPLPAYPIEMVRAKISGSVEMALVIQPDGGIADTKLIKSSQREFEAPVANVIRQWQFRPTAGRGPMAAGVKAVAHVIFEPFPDDRYESALHTPAFVRARLGGHEVARLAIAKAKEEAIDLSPPWDPKIFIYGTREGHSATRDGSVKWLLDDFLPNRQLWIDDSSGLVRIEPKSSFTLVRLRDVPAEILAIARSAAVAHEVAWDEFEGPEARLDTVKSMWILSFRRRGKVIPWTPDFSIYIDAKTHAARYQTGGLGRPATGGP